MKKYITLQTVCTKQTPTGLHVDGFFTYTVKSSHRNKAHKANLAHTKYRARYPKRPDDFNFTFWGFAGKQMNVALTEMSLHGWKRKKIKKNAYVEISTSTEQHKILNELWPNYLDIFYSEVFMKILSEA